MSELGAILDTLEDAKLDYVFERSKAHSDRVAIKKAGIANSSFYKWPAAERKRLAELAQQVRRDRTIQALRVIDAAAEKAADVKVAGLDSKKEYIRQNTASEILDRTIGKTPERHEAEVTLQVEDAREKFARLLDRYAAAESEGGDMCGDDG